MIARLIALAVVGCAVAGAAMTVSTVPVQEVPAIATQSVVITPTAQRHACPGPLAVPVGDVDAGDPDLGSEPTQRALEVWPANGGLPVDGGEGVVLDVRVATSIERVQDGDIAGLAALTCRSAHVDQWLVGGSTAVGSSARLVLINPSLASIEVTVTLFSALGQVERRPVVVLAPMSQKELLLEGIEAEVPALVARVEASGPGVVAVLQDSRLDGFQPAGSDWVTPHGPPASTLVIPGVGIEGTNPTHTSVVRLLSVEGATVTLTLVTREGIVPWLGTTDLDLEPGVVTDVEVPRGSLGAIEIVADHGEVVAAAMTQIRRAASGGIAGSFAYDLGWVAGQHHRDGMSRSVVAPGGPVEIIVSSPTSGTFVLTDAQGEVVVELAMQARTLQSVNVNVAAGTVLSADGRFAWVVRVRDRPGFLTSIAPVRTDIPNVTVTVEVAPYVPVP